MKRFFEILPGVLAWSTIVLMVLFSWLLPVWVSIFIILFDIYWLLKTAYLSLHLRATFITMQKNMKTDWLAKLDDLPNGRAGWDGILHLVILPMFNEPYEVVRESFQSLARARYPKEHLFVVLALEEKAGVVAQEVGERIRQEFSGQFGKFLVTTHPANLPGELAGKGANEAWAGMEAKEKLIDAERIAGRPAVHAGSGSVLDYKKILVSVFDVDTQIFPEYFGRLAYVFLTAEEPLKAIYQPIPLFTNNIYEAPALTRVVAFSSTFWQMMQQSRPERLTSFSSQAIPLQTLIDVGFWQKDIVSEDSRIFWQGFLHYHGDFRVHPLFYPVSMDANVGPTFWSTMENIYKQQRRWGWGVENVPYVLEGFRNDSKIPAAKKRYWRFTMLEGFHSWATNSLMIFALGWLPLFLGGKHFGATLLAFYLPHVTRWIVSLSMLGIVSSAILAIMLLPPKSSGLGARDYFVYFIQWIFMPITLILFGAFPGLESQTRLMLGGRYRLGFWVTPKSRDVKHSTMNNNEKSVQSR